MKIKNVIYILSILAILPQISWAQSANLDEVYRQIIKANNQDYLPMFVKNRQEPNFLKDIESVEGLAEDKKTDLDNIKQVVDFEDKRAIIQKEKRAEELKWQAIVLAVQQNKITPFDIEEIKRKVAKDDSQAVEIFAFMKARGIGVEQDLIKSFLLYQKALNLGIANAKSNAILVYNTMSSYQKRELKALSYKL